MAERPALYLLERSKLLDAPTCPGCGTVLPRAVRRETWVEVPVDPAWVAAYRVVARRGRPLIAEARLFPAEASRALAGTWSGEPGAVPSTGLPGRILKALRLGDPLRLFPKVVRRWEAEHGEEAAGGVFRRFRFSGRAREEVPRRVGRRGRPDRFYAQWAAAYVARLAAGSTRPVKDVAARPPVRIEGYVSSGEEVSPETVRDFIHQARVRGLLTATPIGLAGGELTAKAERLLAQRPRRRSGEGGRSRARSAAPAGP